MTKKFEALLKAQSTAHRAETDALQAKIQTLTDAVERLSVSSPQQKPKATSAETPLLDGSSTQGTKPNIQQISEDDIEAVVESIRTMTRIKQTRDLFSRILSGVIQTTCSCGPVRYEPAVTRAYYSGILVRHEQGDDSWAAMRADLQPILHRTSKAYVGECQQEKGEPIVRYNHRFQGYVQDHERYYLEVHGFEALFLRCLCEVRTEPENVVQADH